MLSVLRPAKIAAFAKSELSRAKTDQADAKLIARYALAMRPSAWMPPPPEMRELQALLRRVEHLLEMQRMEQNRQDTTDATIADSIKAVLATLAKEVLQCAETRCHIDNHPDSQRWRRSARIHPRCRQGHRRLAADPAQRASRLHRRQAGRRLRRPRPRGFASRAGGPVKPASPKLVTGYCARPFTCLSWRPRSSILPFAPSPSASRPTASTAWPSTAPPMRKLIDIAFAILKSGKPFDPEFKPA